MTRFLIALAASALVVGLVGLVQTEATQAQQGGPPVCLSLEAGEHSFTAPARDREGEVSFTVVVGDGGVVTEFIEPGGQSIPASAMLQLFTGDDAYPLPEGVAIVECEAGGDSMMEDAAPGVCVNLPAGTHAGTVSAGGRSYDLTMNVGEGGRLDSVELLGQSYTAQEAIGLLEGFGATLPQGVQIVECAASDSMQEDSMQEDSMEEAEAQPTLYANTGSGGLAHEGASNAVWYALAASLLLAGGLSGLAISRRRATQRA